MKNINFNFIERKRFKELLDIIVQTTHGNKENYLFDAGASIDKNPKKYLEITNEQELQRLVSQIDEVGKYGNGEYEEITIKEVLTKLDQILLFEEETVYYIDELDGLLENIQQTSTKYKYHEYGLSEDINCDRELIELYFYNPDLKNLEHEGDITSDENESIIMEKVVFKHPKVQEILSKHLNAKKELNKYNEERISLISNIKIEKEDITIKITDEEEYLAISSEIVVPGHDEKIGANDSFGGRWEQIDKMNVFFINGEDAKECVEAFKDIVLEPSRDYAETFSLEEKNVAIDKYAKEIIKFLEEFNKALKNSSKPEYNKLIKY